MSVISWGFSASLQFLTKGYGTFHRPWVQIGIKRDLVALGPIATNAEQHAAISGSTHDTFTNSNPANDGWRDRQVTVPSSSTLSQGLQRDCHAQANLLTNAPIGCLHFWSTLLRLVLLHQSYSDFMFCWRNSSCFRSEIIKGAKTSSGNAHWRNENWT